LSAKATAGVDTASVSLFGGEITADALAARAGATGAAGDFSGTALTNLVVEGQPVQPSPGLRVQVGDWGHLFTLEQDVRSTAASYRGTLIALDVVVDVDHGGLPAGSHVQLGLLQVAAVATPAPKAPATTTEPQPPPTTTPAPTATQPAAPTPAPTAPAPAPTAPAPTKKKASPKHKQPNKKAKTNVHMLPPSVHPNLGQGLYVFPVYGPVGYGDSYGAARSDVTYHHGDDLFAPLGAPVLAVADGTVYSVGWEKLGGNRLWLRDQNGNEFYYAHLAAYSTLAVNGVHVSAGDVLGFVGNTGDADGTAYHLHFEVHPVPFLFLGEDGAVDPTAYLDHWRRLHEIRLRPAVGGGPPLASKSGPPPGAVLLQSVDISTADGLDPGSLERVMAGGTG
jgi:murein DD-endopeptidase MepM/ murein hydrolase activator NlpD